MESSRATNYYSVLGISADSTQKDINAAFKKLVLIHHPDKTGGDKASVDEFRLICEAKEVLSNPEQRRLHDEALRLHSRPAISKKYSRRYYASDDPSNWFKDDPSWSPSRRDWNLNDPTDRYQFTFGTCVHMDPNSEASREELARHENDIEEWEMRYAGIDPEVEKAKKEYLEEVMRAQAQQDENMESEAAVQAGEDMQIKERRADEDVEWEEEIISTEGNEDYSGVEKEKVDFHRNVFEPDSEDMIVMPTQPHSNTDIGWLIDLNDSEHHALPIQSRANMNETHAFVEPIPPAPNYMPEPIRNDGARELLQPYIPFFTWKLNTYSTEYSADHMHAEMQGLLHEIDSSWSGKVRHSFSDIQSLQSNDAQPCLHLGTWHKYSGICTCPRCHLWMPIFVLKCSSCGIQACTRCKYARGG